MHELSQSASLRVERARGAAGRSLLPFFVIRDCTYCFDSVDDEQDVEEGSVHRCKPPRWIDALHQTPESIRSFSSFLNLNRQPNYSSVSNPTMVSYLFYFLLHIPQLALPLSPLHVEPLHELSFLPRPVSFAELQATAQVHGCGASVLQDPPLLFPLPAERRSLPVLLARQLASSNDQPGALSRFQLERKTGSAEEERQL